MSAVSLGCARSKIESAVYQQQWDHMYIITLIHGTLHREYTTRLPDACVEDNRDNLGHDLGTWHMHDQLELSRTLITYSICVHSINDNYAVEVEL